MGSEMCIRDSTGHETSNVDAVMNGDIDGFLRAYLMGEGAGADHSDDV